MNLNLKRNHAEQTSLYKCSHRCTQATPLSIISHTPLLDVQSLNETVNKRKDATNSDPITVRV